MAADGEHGETAWKAVDKTYTEFVEFLRSTYQTSDSLQMETHGITGTKEFCAWEVRIHIPDGRSRKEALTSSQWTLRIVADADDPIRGLWKGKEVVLRGSSLHWWRLQPGKDGGEVSDWRIVQEADYACH